MFACDSICTCYETIITLAQRRALHHSAQKVALFLLLLLLHALVSNVLFVHVHDLRCSTLEKSRFEVDRHVVEVWRRPSTRLLRKAFQDEVMDGNPNKIEKKSNVLSLACSAQNADEHSFRK